MAARLGMTLVAAPLAALLAAALFTLGEASATGHVVVTHIDDCTQTPDFTYYAVTTRDGADVYGSAATRETDQGVAFIMVAGDRWDLDGSTFTNAAHPERQIRITNDCTRSEDALFCPFGFASGGGCYAEPEHRAALWTRPTEDAAGNEVKPPGCQYYGNGEGGYTACLTAPEFAALFEGREDLWSKAGRVNPTDPSYNGR